MTENRTLRSYFRTYYEVNRRTWPEMTRRAAALDALRLTWKIRRFRHAED